MPENIYFESDRITGMLSKQHTSVLNRTGFEIYDDRALERALCSCVRKSPEEYEEYLTQA